MRADKKRDRRESVQVVVGLQQYKIVLHRIHLLNDAERSKKLL